MHYRFETIIGGGFEFYENSLVVYSKKYLMDIDGQMKLVNGIGQSLTVERIIIMYKYIKKVSINNNVQGSVNPQIYIDLSRDGCTNALYTDYNPQIIEQLKKKIGEDKIEDNRYYNTYLYNS